MVEIIVGRDPDTGRLKLLVGKQMGLTGEPGSVPQTVSRQHCSLQLQDDGSYLLTNLKAENVTYVNGMAYEKKVVGAADRVELGPDRFPLDWAKVEQAIPTSEREVDIRPLKQVWDDYEGFIMKSRIDERKFNNQRQVIGLLTMGAMALGMLTGRSTPLLLPVYVVAIALGVYFFLKANKKATQMPKVQDEAKKLFHKKYVCPECGRYLGQDYDLLVQGRSCPYCRVKFKC